MSVSAAVLRELHRIHIQLGDLRERLERGPRQVHARQANVAQQQTKLAAAQEKMLQTKKAADQKQLDLRSGENKIEDLKGKLNTCGSNREYQALVEQIAAAEMANSVLADEILEAFEKADQLAVAVTQAEQDLAAVESDLAKCRDTVAEEGTLIRGDIDRLEGELAEAEKSLPATLKDDYRRVIRGKGAEGMAQMDDGVCQGCGQQITLNMQSELMMSQPVFCKSCGRLLYIAET